MPLAAAVPAIISGGSSIIGGLLGSSSSNKAAKQAGDMQRAAGKSLEELSQLQYDAQSNNLNPYLSAGQTGVNALSAAYQPGGELAQKFSFDPSQIANNPNYQFVLQQGTDAVQKSAAAKGGLFSGGTMKALDQYSQGLATQTINDAYAQSLNTFQTNHNNMFQGLSALTSVGQNANDQMERAGELRARTFTAGTDAYMGAGASQANGTLNAGNAWQNALQGVTGPLINLAGNLPRSSVTMADPGSYATMPTYSTPPYIPPPPSVYPVPTGGY